MQNRLPHRRMKPVTAGAIAALMCALAACSSPPAPRPTVDFDAMPQQATVTPSPPVAGTAVTIDNFAFVPATLTVKLGDTVTWTNHDEEPHTVAATGGAFHSPGMDNNGTYSFTFTTAGTFDYVCSIHPFMHGTVVVTP